MRARLRPATGIGGSHREHAALASSTVVARASAGPTAVPRERRSLFGRRLTPNNLREHAGAEVVDWNHTVQRPVASRESQSPFGSSSPEPAEPRIPSPSLRRARKLRRGRRSLIPNPDPPRVPRHPESRRLGYYQLRCTSSWRRRLPGAPNSSAQRGSRTRWRPQMWTRRSRWRGADRLCLARRARQGAQGHVVSRHHPLGVVLAADTVVAVGDEILGKPEDRSRRGARCFACSPDRTHEVHTAVVVRQRRS